MADATAASPAPATVPKLKNACMSGITVLRSSRSASAPSTFIITSTAPLPKPNNARPITTSGTDGAMDPPMPTSTRPTATVTSTPVMPSRAPKRAMSHGAAMSPRIEAMDPARMTSPTPWVERSTSSRMAGRRATQLARLRPERKKIVNIALRHALSSRLGRAASAVSGGVPVIFSASSCAARSCGSNRFDTPICEPYRSLAMSATARRTRVRPRAIRGLAVGSTPRYLPLLND